MQQLHLNYTNNKSIVVNARGYEFEYAEAYHLTIYGLGRNYNKYDKNL